MESKRPRLDSTVPSGEAESELTLTQSNKTQKHLLFHLLKIRTQIQTRQDVYSWADSRDVYFFAFVVLFSSVLPTLEQIGPFCAL